MSGTKYIAKKPDATGVIHYTDEENNVWETLYNRQLDIIQDRACDDFIDGLKTLKLSSSKIPQCNDLNDILIQLTGWSVTPVKALISFDDFFTLLSKKQFPAASFIRIPEEIDYLQEPDIFHEVFGHCPMLTNQKFADFTEAVGHLGLSLNKSDRAYLARLYWFTVEFGLIRSDNALKVYGGGILSSKAETKYALESDIPLRLDFDLLTILRTPYRHDEMQLTYYIINNFDELYKLVDQAKLSRAILEARELGMLMNRHNAKETDQRSC